MPKHRSNKATRKLSVAKAIEELNRLKKVDAESQIDDTEITETFTEELATDNLLEKEPTSDTLNQDTETGFGLNVPRLSKDEIDSKIENASLKVETKIKDDIHSIKEKCSSISIGISLSICGVVSAILIAVMTYMNNGLKNEITILKKDVMAKIDVLSSAIDSISQKLVKTKTQGEVVPKTIGHPKDKSEKSFK